jgi:hypothetical protein
MRVDVMKKDSFNHLRRRSSADHTDRRASRGRSPGPDRRASRKESDMESGYRRRQSSDEVTASVKPSMFSQCGFCVRVALVLYALVAAVFIYSLLRQRSLSASLAPASGVAGTISTGAVPMQAAAAAAAAGADVAATASP